MKRKYFIILLPVAVLLSLLVYWLSQQNIDIAIYYSIGWIVVVLALLALGNRLITTQFDQYFPWLKYGGLRLFLHLLLGIVYSLFVINLAYLIFKSVLTIDPPTDEQLVVMNVYGAVIFVPLYSIYFSYQFLTHWRKSELAAEKFRKEHIRSQLESLKNHLDPHFLFNNLNILSSLIDKDKALSKKFLDKFAEVYRTILKTKDEDLITLEEELNYIDSYLFLIKTRFENISMDINISKAHRQHSLPPLTLQMLIENALKHNIIAEEKPLLISIKSQDEGFLKVTNTLNEKPHHIKDLKGSGLENIRGRYQYFTDKQVRIEKTAAHFIVFIPLIEVETV